MSSELVTNTYTIVTKYGTQMVMSEPTPANATTAAPQYALLSGTNNQFTNKNIFNNTTTFNSIPFCSIDASGGNQICNLNTVNKMISNYSKYDCYLVNARLIFNPAYFYIANYYYYTNIMYDPKNYNTYLGYYNKYVTNYISYIQTVQPVQGVSPPPPLKQYDVFDLSNSNIPIEPPPTSQYDYPPQQVLNILSDDGYTYLMYGYKSTITSHLANTTNNLFQPWSYDLWFTYNFNTSGVYTNNTDMSGNVNKLYPLYPTGFNEYNPDPNSNPNPLPLNFSYSTIQYAINTTYNTI